MFLMDPAYPDHANSWEFASMAAARRWARGYFRGRMFGGVGFLGKAVPLPGVARIRISTASGSMVWTAGPRGGIREEIA